MLSYIIIEMILLIGLIVFLVFFLRKANNRKYFKTRKVEQTKVSRLKLLPVYRYNSIYIIALIVEILICTASFIFDIKYNLFVTMKGKIIIFIEILFFTTIFTYTYMIHYKLKNSLLFCKEKIQEKYQIIDEYYGRINSNEMNEIAYNIKCMTNDQRTYAPNKMIEFLTINTDNKVMIGSIKQWHSYGDEYRYENCSSFVELNVPYSFKSPIRLLFSKYEKEDISIIPQYSNVPIIIGNKWYAEKVITQDIQADISELAKKLKNYSMTFQDNRITLILDNVLWSTWFERTFMKKKCAENICFTINEIVNALNKIEEKIRNNA